MLDVVLPVPTAIYRLKVFLEDLRGELNTMGGIVEASARGAGLCVVEPVYQFSESAPSCGARPKKLPKRCFNDVLLPLESFSSGAG